MKLHSRFPVIVASGLAFCFLLMMPLLQAVDVPAVFSDHAVFQRDLPLPIWGTGDPGTEVTVQFAGQQKTAMVAKDGNWTTTLDPMPASAEGRTMTIEASDGTIEVKDILVGEVWLCGGQSNMEWAVRSSNDADAEIAAGDTPWLRRIKTPHLLSRTPQADIDCAWEVSTKESIGNFTAVGTFMARRLHQELGVPIGILDINWGGTRAEPWTSIPAMQRHPRFRARVNKLQSEFRRWGDRSTAEIDALYQDQMKGFEQTASSWWQKKLDGDPGIAGSWADTGFSDEDWSEAPVPGLWSGDDEGWDGVIWYRNTIEVPAEWVGRDLVMRPGAIDDADITYWDGEEIGRTTNQHGALRNYVIPGDQVQAGAATIAIAALDTGGAGGITGSAGSIKILPAGAKEGEAIALAGTWKVHRGNKFSGDRGPSPPSKPEAPGRKTSDPGVMFNAMLSPFVHYGIRGAIWYQGESNAGQAAEYAELLPLMIGSWREAWGQGDFPFGIVQLAAFKAVSDNPVQGGWATLREAQDFTHRVVRNTGLVVLTDVGDARDIHPRNKQAVGNRLADWALNRCHGRADLPESGPFFRGHEVDGNSILVQFDHVGAGLTGRRGKQIDGFAIQGSDGNWHWAEVEVVSADQLRISHPEAPAPTAVRFGWQDNPVRANLVSSHGLPAAPFKTD
ncbi:MAG: sialate O-acetylesterase [Planctomycetota bacterium]|nr:sialate O-acetylesterase [Planctomycetota bacterium]